MSDSWDMRLLLQADLPNSTLATFTRDLQRDLTKHLGVVATSPPALAQEGERGDALAIGELLLTFMTSGMATALVGCLKTYLNREPTLNVRVLRPDGTEVSVSAKNINDKGLVEAVIALLPGR